MSRSSKQQNENSKAKIQKTQKSDLDPKRYENTVNHLNNMLMKEKGKVRELKNLYMKEMTGKS